MQQQFSVKLLKTAALTVFFVIVQFVIGAVGSVGFASENPVSLKLNSKLVLVATKRNIKHINVKILQELFYTKYCRFDRLCLSITYDVNSARCR